ncbi:hypothetical protein GE061_003966 [Apolygus lucorum]|uniref:Regulatory protein zeste n=1 Tax=Apolygus lucorum TaxID=248454 RepID=A0A8S9WZB3_APOLU|nr:hypothetical protein GE061_003966 [Apolygus lucorum]
MVREITSESATEINDAQQQLEVPSSPSDVTPSTSRTSSSVTEIGSDKTVCYFWHEGLGHRGANEIGTGVYKYLAECSSINPGQNVVLYSDNCGGQQKNRSTMNKRTVFGEEEKILLKSLVLKNSRIVESKCSDAESVVKKKECWDKITEEFNSCGRFPVRHSTLSLRTPQNLTTSRSALQEHQIKGWFSEVNAYIRSKDLLMLLNKAYEDWKSTDENTALYKKLKGSKGEDKEKSGGGEKRKDEEDTKHGEETPSDPTNKGSDGEDIEMAGGGEKRHKTDEKVTQSEKHDDETPSVPSDKHLWYFIKFVCLGFLSLVGYELGDATARVSRSMTPVCNKCEHCECAKPKSDDPDHERSAVYGFLAGSIEQILFEHDDGGQERREGCPFESILETRCLPPESGSTQGPSDNTELDDSTGGDEQISSINSRKAQLTPSPPPPLKRHRNGRPTECPQANEADASGLLKKTRSNNTIERISHQTATAASSTNHVDYHDNGSAETASTITILLDPGLQRQLYRLLHTWMALASLFSRNTNAAPNFISDATSLHTDPHHEFEGRITENGSARREWINSGRMDSKSGRMEQQQLPSPGPEPGGVMPLPGSADYPPSWDRAEGDRQCKFTKYQGQQIPYQRLVRETCKVKVSNKKFPDSNKANFKSTMNKRTLFGEEEKRLLKSLVLKNSRIVESKCSDAESVVKKKECWDKITEEFNSCGRFPVHLKSVTEHMGGVDLSDMLIALYRTPLRSHRWYLAFFDQLLDICVDNAWLMYRRMNSQGRSETNEEQGVGDTGSNQKGKKNNNTSMLPLKEFRADIAEGQTKKGTARSLFNKKTNRSSTSSPSVSVNDPTDDWESPQNHLPSYTNKEATVEDKSLNCSIEIK